MTDSGPAYAFPTDSNGHSRLIRETGSHDAVHSFFLVLGLGDANRHTANEHLGRPMAVLPNMLTLTKYVSDTPRPQH